MSVPFNPSQAMRKTLYKNKTLEKHRPNPWKTQAKRSGNSPEAHVFLELRPAGRRVSGMALKRTELVCWSRIYPSSKGPRPFLLLARLTRVVGSIKLEVPATTQRAALPILQNTDRLGGFVSPHTLAAGRARGRSTHHGSACNARGAPYQHLVCVLGASFARPSIRPSVPRRATT